MKKFLYTNLLIEVSQIKGQPAIHGQLSLDKNANLTRERQHSYDTERAGGMATQICTHGNKPFKVDINEDTVCELHVLWLPTR